MEKVRIGVIGGGGMGNAHCQEIEKLDNVELACICDVVKEVAEERAKEYGVKYFTSYKELIDSGLCDAVIVATIHWLHPEISIYAFSKGLHVLSEKPISVTVSDADKMISAWEKSGKVFSVVYQRRAEPHIRKAKEIISSGEIGEIQRTLCIDPWFRTQAYYDSGTWRATWKGEGGGVTLNQAPHFIDIFTMLAGMPSRVYAMSRSKFHDIEVEDEVSAMLEYPNGSWGYYYTSTCEPVGPQHIEIAGDKGKLIIHGTDISFYKYQDSVTNYINNSDDMWASLKSEQQTVNIDTSVGTGHGEIVRNFTASILKGEKLIVEGSEGLHSIEFINACIMSGIKGRPVAIPLDRGEYDVFIEEMKKTSKPKARVKVQRATDPKLQK